MLHVIKLQRINQLSRTFSTHYSKSEEVIITDTLPSISLEESGQLYTSYFQSKQCFVFTCYSIYNGIKPLSAYKWLNLSQGSPQNQALTQINNTSQSILEEVQRLWLDF